MFELTSLNEIQKQQYKPGGFGRVRMYLPLSERVDKDSIGFRMHLINALCRLAGIRLSVVGKWDKQTSKVTPEISGVNGQNTAVSSVAVAEERVDEINSSIDLNRDLQMCSRVSDVNVEINFQEIAQKIEDEARKDISVSPYSPDRWSHYIGRAIARGIYEEAPKNLTSNMSFSDKVQMFCAYGVSVATLGVYVNIAAQYNLELSPLMIGTMLMAGGQYENFANYIQTKVGGKGEFRYTLFAGPQYDREAILKLALLSIPLGKAIKKSEAK